MTGQHDLSIIQNLVKQLHFTELQLCPASATSPCAVLDAQVSALREAAGGGRPGASAGVRSALSERRGAQHLRRCARSLMERIYDNLLGKHVEYI